MERLQQQVQGIGTKTKTPHLTTGKGVQTDKAKSPQGNQLQVMEKEEDDKRGEFEESDDELDDSRDDRTKESGRKLYELRNKARELKQRLTIGRGIGKSSRIELLFIQEKEKLEKGLLSRLESVTEEKQSLHQQIWVLSQYHEKVKELSKKLRASEQHLKKRIETCRILEQDLQTAQDKSNELGATVKTLTQENGRSKSQNQADSNRITFLEERRRELEYDLKEKATQLQQQKQFRGQTQTQVETQLRAEIERKTQETKELTVKMEKQEEDVRNVQQLAIRIVGKPQHSILSDSEIREEFESEKASMKEWAKKWVVPELTRSKSEYESSALPKELQKVVLVGTPPKQSIKDLLKQVKPRIAVHALLAQFFAERIFQQCFLPLHEAAKLSPATSFSASMTRLLELFIRSSSHASYLTAPVNPIKQRTPLKRTLGAPKPSSSSPLPPRSLAPPTKPSPATSSRAPASSFSKPRLPLRNKNSRL